MTPDTLASRLAQAEALLRRWIAPAVDGSSEVSARFYDTRAFLATPAVPGAARVCGDYLHSGPCPPACAKCQHHAHAGLCESLVDERTPCLCRSPSPATGEPCKHHYGCPHEATGVAPATPPQPCDLPSAQPDWCGVCGGDLAVQRTWCANPAHRSPTPAKGMP